jgi:CubicO group peptidase (beta-lactamase class C family)
MRGANRSTRNSGSSLLRRSALVTARLLWACCLGCLPATARGAVPDPVADIVRAFAAFPVDSGLAVGVGVGIVMPGRPPRYFSYGLADASSGQPFGPDTIFEIGSVTKVFTTNLLGQAVHDGQRHLDDPLSAFATQLGRLKPMTGQVTLQDLGDFTGGFPSYAPPCVWQRQPPGCLPTSRPKLTVYTARDFVKFFQGAIPRDYQAKPHKPVYTLPAPYNYSDFSVGLLGLLLGGDPRARLTNAALDGWFGLISQRLLGPLHMDSTYLYVPSASQARVAPGYEPAIATPIVAQGRLSAINLVDGGLGYSQAPAVTISGGGGSGASATAAVASGKVTGFTVSSGGSGYLDRPSVVFDAPSGGSTPATPARGAAIVAGGKVVAITILDGGAGYAAPPMVAITGGRRTGRDATGTVHIADGEVTYVTIDDGGDGYVDPIAVIVAPGAGGTLGVPIWAPAGSLKSTIRDMTTFAAAALGQAKIGALSVDPAITAGFEIAETSYACAVGAPELSTCPRYTAQSGLSWAITPGDQAQGVPRRVAKNGGITGFSTEVLLMPARGLAVVVFANSRTGAIEKAISARIARNILYGLFYQTSP